MDGHRKCNLCLTPAQTRECQGICPVCGRKITVGVAHRVEELSDRPEGYVRADAKVFESLVPLPEVIGASAGRSPASVRVQEGIFADAERTGTGIFDSKRNSSGEIEHVSGSRVAEGIRRLRSGQVERIPGFDGEYGKIRLFDDEK